ncbi:MAG TPA: PIN domain-containing protein [Blastocatellia bacterium]|nr:PIN domain-containing protein [Blastocatellia bacterium]
MLVDTSGWACIADRRERHHAEASQIFRNALRQRTKIITTNYILSELVSLLTSPKRLDRPMIVSFIEAIKTAPNVELIHIDIPLDEAAWQLIITRQDKEWSLVDCASFAVMQRRKITDALTTDHHFEQAGFIRLLK